MKRQKNLALRKRVATRQTTLLQVMQADDSSDKRHVHRRLAADTDIIQACCKRQLRTLCETHAIPCSARDDKRALVLKLQEIPSRKGISKPENVSKATSMSQSGLCVAAVAIGCTEAVPKYGRRMSGLTWTLTKSLFVITAEGVSTTSRSYDATDRWSR